MANKIGDYMAEHGVKFIKESVPCKIEKVEGDRRKVAWVNSNDKSKKIIGEDVFDTVMLAIGRNADTKKLGCDKVGIELKPNGKIVCKDDDTTNVPSIFAIGDVVHSRLELTPTAIMAGRLLARRLFNKETEIMDYRNIATTVFTPLEYGACGYSEEDAVE
jgi:pyruvate/2-oxoglutarate dehydrogenase complex dihydrolipoamide dehydrogenase (E3) component